MPPIEKIGFRFVLDSTVIISLLCGAFWLNSRMAVMEERIDSLRAGQVAEARIVRIEEQQKALVEKVNETNLLIRDMIAKQRKNR